MIAMNKVGALYAKQMQNFAYNTFILIGLVVSPLIVFLFARMMPDASALALPMGVLMNIVFGGANTMCVLIAEEKEKNTLNVLITSTVSGMDFLLSNALATLTMTVALNALIYAICGAFTVPLLPFLLVTTLGSLAAIALGAIIGILSKNQMSASCIITPFALILILVPTFAQVMPAFQAIGAALFSQQTIILLDELAGGNFSAWRIAVILANIIVLSGIFALVYKRVGLEK